jgi:hypothetical protein
MDQLRNHRRCSLQGFAYLANPASHEAAHSGAPRLSKFAAPRFRPPPNTQNTNQAQFFSHKPEPPPRPSPLPSRVSRLPPASCVLRLASCVLRLAPPVSRLASRVSRLASCVLRLASCVSRPHQNELSTKTPLIHSVFCSPSTTSCIRSTKHTRDVAVFILSRCPLLASCG